MPARPLTLSRLHEDLLVSVAMFCSPADGMSFAVASRWARDIASKRVAAELGVEPAPEPLGVAYCWLRFVHACGGASATELALYAGRLEMRVLPGGEGNGATFSRDVAVCVHCPRARWLSTALRFPLSREWDAWARRPPTYRTSLPRPGEPTRIKHPPPLGLCHHLQRAELDASAAPGYGPDGYIPRESQPYAFDCWGRYRPVETAENKRSSMGPFLVCRVTALGDADDARKLAEISGYLVSHRGFAMLLEGYDTRVGPLNRMFFVPRTMMRFDERGDRTVLVVDNRYPEHDDEQDEDELWALLPVAETSGRNTHTDWWKSTDAQAVDEICEQLSIIVSEIEHAPRGLDEDFYDRIREDDASFAANAGLQMRVEPTRDHPLR